MYIKEKVRRLKINIKEIKNLSKNQLKGHWKIPVLLTLAYCILVYISGILQNESSSLTTMILSFLLTIAISTWLTVGLPRFYLKFIDTNGNANFRDVLVTKKALLKSLIYNIIVMLISFIVIFVSIFAFIGIGTTLIFTQGSISLYTMFIIAIVSFVVLIFIVFTLSIEQVPYLIIEYEELGILEAMSLSMKIMKGYKTKLFILKLSFIGWAILCLFTFGLGFFWLQPYIFVSQTNFYRMLNL